MLLWLVTRKGALLKSPRSRSTPPRPADVQDQPRDGGPTQKGHTVKAAAFEYVRARSLEEACALLIERGEDARVVAGGQSLVPAMAMRFARPAWLIDINHIAELQYIRRDGAALRIGACTRQCDLEASELVAQHVPLIQAALRWVGHQQTRNRGTLGGSLAHADPSAELPLTAVVLGATVHVQGKSGRRTLPAPDLFLAPTMTTLNQGEIITEIEWPIWEDGRTGCAFAEVSVRQGDFAIVDAAAQIALDANGRCVRAVYGIGGADATPRQFNELAQELVGSAVADAALEKLAAAAAEQLEPGEDLHGTAEYRRHLARRLGARALREARDAAKGNQ